MLHQEHYQHKIGEALIHVVNHSTDHRAQMLRLIGDYGGQTFEQDIIFYLRAEAIFRVKKQFAPLSGRYFPVVPDLPPLTCLLLTRQPVLRQKA